MALEPSEGFASIDELVELLVPVNNDVLAIVDLSEIGEKTKKIKFATLIEYIKTAVLADLRIGRTINVTEDQGAYVNGNVIVPTDLIPQIIENMLTGLPTSPTFRPPTLALHGTIFNGTKDVGVKYSGSVILTFIQNAPSNPTYGASNGLPTQYTISYNDENNSPQVLTFSPSDPEVNGTVVTVSNINIIADQGESIQGSVIYLDGTDGVVGGTTFTNPYKTGSLNTSRLVPTSQFTYWGLTTPLVPPNDPDNLFTETLIKGLTNKVTYSNVLNILNQTISGQKNLVFAVPATKTLVSFVNVGAGNIDETGTVQAPKTVNVNGVPYKVYWKLFTSSSTTVNTFKITFS